MLGVLFGPLGLLLAVPLVAATLLAEKMLYIYDVLGEKVELPSGEEG